MPSAHQITWVALNDALESDTLEKKTFTLKRVLIVKITYLVEYTEVRTECTVFGHLSACYLHLNENLL